MLEILHKPHVDPVKYPLLDGYWPLTILLISYLLFVLKLGKLHMANRQPYNLGTVLKVYNIFQVIYNTVLFIAISYYIFWERVYNFKCLSVLPLDHSHKNAERIISYAYFINKIIDLLDTIFIVLRKSYRQITVLHLVHHVYMVAASYVCIRFNGYGGHPMFVGYLNLLVHSVMYSYYYLASVYPSIKQSTWKEYMTIMQMIQFVMIFVHNIVTYMQPNCDVSPYMMSLVFVMTLVMLAMFTNFYIHSYVMAKDQRQEVFDYVKLKEKETKSNKKD
ncbi:elongation of very long chain fatty acids protein F-like [Drosophila sulfurigaster albostrigata]|uniref:elongation of very long chain fatty acids protein F-like n=1 Tax=Drosophila sulfurigaster albostrigata TaxID=89887 RepID=UPI002D21B285|nr:elongation of very long chain fatty acids protein F-like [Drosophila sulfurigaster albostrigata]